MKPAIQIADEFLSKWDGKTCHPEALAKVLTAYRNEALEEAIEELRLLIVSRRKANG